MGNYAASGGYYISCAADKIFASPTTITGSIGVFGLYLSAEELLTEKMLTLFTYIIHNLSAKKEYIVYFFLREFRTLNKL